MKKLLAIAIAVSFFACTDACENSANTERDTSAVTTKANNQETKEERNKQTALNSISGFSQRRADVVLKDADKDFIDYADGSVPPMKGLDSARVGLQAWMDAFSDFQGSDVTAVADGDYVIVWGTWSGRWTKEFMGMKPTNKSFKVFDADILKFNDAGKIIEHRSVQSFKTMAEQIGMKMQ